MKDVTGISSERLGRIVEETASEVYPFAADDFRFAMVNRGARENLGFSMEELRTRTPGDIKPEITQDAFLQLVEPLLSGTVPQLDYETGPGTFHAVAQPGRDGGIGGIGPARRSDQHLVAGRKHPSSHLSGRPSHGPVGFRDGATRPGSMAYRSTVLNAFREVEDRMAVVANLSEQEAALQAQRTAVADALRHAANRYRAGYTPYIEQIDAQRALLSVDLSLIQTRADELSTLVGLYQAIGGAPE